MRSISIAIAIGLSGCGGGCAPRPSDGLVRVEEAVHGAGESVGAAVAAVAAQVEKLAARVDGIQANLDAWIPTFMSRMDRAEKRIDALESRNEFALGEQS
jgi:hypothetical protein